MTTPATTQPATKDLLNSAVNNTHLFTRKGFLDRLFTKWFDRLVYPQIWEDPEVDIRALELDQHSRVFTISSGGCNALNYLTVEPNSITVVDLNEAHIALIKLKKAALKHLPDHESFFDFFGRADRSKTWMPMKSTSNRIWTRRPSTTGKAAKPSGDRVALNTSPTAFTATGCWGALSGRFTGSANASVTTSVRSCWPARPRNSNACSTNTLHRCSTPV